ncbi:MAG: fumarate reductase/succinate dehydrogenase flavoprotein subunit [Saprospiraceae bacterium]|jgi:succinate dehydrogenase / fumarate reductase flavoprotein subunit|nr:fumarate reductase/succinate dehydrogenase flavoprotein subunit [Saprospiraceae bacterium]MDC3210648.1 fumarate reductase/succinate dehydrogenase flavoprotein subunit [Saprospiraceae bacterium]MDG1434922.1 fumarate reductase/succinate dehydrogenase flavoprotein subunit [Saprospiraceae bacterium]MDG2419433.1 fumarate reductase/succinate dehydrogenase flavoprotein subunit [Saprospiraceae bacterium]
MELKSNIPEGKIATKWENYRGKMNLVAPNNKRRLEIIVVGTGLAGASAAATFGELGYKVKCFTFHDSPRRAHSIAAQGGINAAKNYQNDGDSVYRLFYDTVKGGDYRSREANVHRLAEVSRNIIDQCVAQGVPFAREYGGLLANRSFGGVQVSRTFYARGQTGQQLLLGAYQALSRQISLGNVEMYNRHEMLDLVKIDGKARGIIARNMLTGKSERFPAHCVVLATGGYGNVFYLSTNAMGSNVTAAWRAVKKGALMANPCYTQIHPTCIPVSGEYQSKLTLMSESLRNDGRVWVPNKVEDAEAIQRGEKTALDIEESDRDYYLERRYPAFGNLVPRDVASRAAKVACDEGKGVSKTGLAVYLDFAAAIQRYGKSAAISQGIKNPNDDKIIELGEAVVKEKYGNLFQMYEKITAENPYKMPMKIYPAVHYTMGGVWVDYNLETNVPGLFCLGEANFSDHGANRLGASALMQGLADGYFVIPYTVGPFLSKEIRTPQIDANSPEFLAAEKETNEKLERLIKIQGNQSVESFHRRLGKIMWEYCGMARDAEGLKKGRQMIRDLRAEFYNDVFVPGEVNEFNPELEKASRVADFLELGEVMMLDALDRDESCGGHFRSEYASEEGEAKRNDEDYAYVAAWEWDEIEPKVHKEHLEFKDIELKTRSYK